MEEYFRRWLAAYSAKVPMLGTVGEMQALHSAFASGWDAAYCSEHGEEWDPNE